MVRPPPSSAPACAAASMPSARPLITLTPASASSRASVRAKRSPAGRGSPRADHGDGGRRARGSQRERSADVQPLGLAGAEVAEARGPFGRRCARARARGSPSPEPRPARDQGERLGDVLAPDAAALREVGRRARQPQHAHLPAGAQALDAAARSSSSRASGAMPRRSSSASSRRAFGIA